VVYLLFGALLGLIPAAIASRKGHPFVLYWIFGALVFIVALPMALLVGPNKEARQQCPSCREWVDREATVCARCGRDIPESARTAAAAQPQDPWYQRPS
jgi:hypothetical protein